MRKTANTQCNVVRVSREDVWVLVDGDKRPRMISWVSLRHAARQPDAEASLIYRRVLKQAEVLHATDNGRKCITCGCDPWQGMYGGELHKNQCYRCLSQSAELDRADREQVFGREEY